MSRHFKTQQNAVEDGIRRILSVKGVQGLLVMNRDGKPIVTTFDEPLTAKYAYNGSHLINQTRIIITNGSVVDESGAIYERTAASDSSPSASSSSELQYLRLRTTKVETMICTGTDYSVLVVQVISPNNLL